MGIWAEGAGAAPGAPGNPEKTARFRRTWRPAALVVFVTAIAAVAALVGSSFPRVIPTVLLRRACASTIARRTAVVSVTESIGLLGQKERATAVGKVDWSRTSESLVLTELGQSVTEFFGRTGTDIFDPELGRIATGKSWVSLPVSFDSSDTAFGIMQQKDDKVTLLGPRSIGGVSVVEYRVDVDHAAIRHVLSTQHYPKVLQRLLQVTATTRLTSLRQYVFVTRDGLVQTIKERGSLRTHGQRATETSTMTFHTYGAHFELHPPPASRILRFEAYIEDLLAHPVSSA